MKNRFFLALLALLLAASYPIQAQVQLVAHPNQDSTLLNGVYSVFYEFQGKVYFSARDNIGNALFDTDGTSSGTHLITRDFEPEAFSSCGDWLYVYGSKAQYSIPWENPFGQYAIWRMRADGSECQKLVDLYKPYSMYAHSFHLWSANNRVFFSWRGGLSWIDNTTGNVAKVFQGLNKENERVEDYYLVNKAGTTNGLFFLTGENSIPYFYYTDLTKEGTVELARIYTKGPSIPMDNMLVFNNRAYVLHVADTMQLWSSDGTPGGTSKIWQNTNYPANKSAPFYSAFFEYKDELIFDIPEIVNDTLWHSIYTFSDDKVKLLQRHRHLLGYQDITFDPRPDGLYVYVNDFANPGKLEIWLKDEAGYRKVNTFQPTGQPDWISPVNWENGLFIVHSQNTFFYYDRNFSLIFSTGIFGSLFYPSSLGVFFTRTENQRVIGPWVLKTNPPSCTEVKRLISDQSYGSINSLTPVGDQLYFAANSKEYGTEVWVTGGQSGSACLAKDVNESGNAQPDDLIPFMNKMIFTVPGTYPFSGLWISDGTTDGTKKLEDLVILEDDKYCTKVVWKDKIYFSGQAKSTNDQEWHLWVSDGTPGKARIFDEQFSNLHFTWVHSLTAVGDHLYFIADGGGKDTELWVTDGTEAGTFSIDALTVDRIYLQNTEGPKLLASGSKLFVTRDKPDDDPKKMDITREVWVTDGTAAGTKCFADFGDDRNTTFLKFLGIHKGNLLFTCTTATDGLELWYSGGDRSNTVQLTGLQDARSNNDKQFTEGVALGDQFFFIAFTEENGYELWVTDGTAAGTHIFIELAHGQQSTSPKCLTEVGDKLIFFTEGEGIDHSLWITDGTIEGTEPLPWDFAHLNNFKQAHFWQNALYFVASHPETGQGIYRYDLPGVLGTGAFEKPNAETGLILYPNPATTYLKIDLTGQFPNNAHGKLVTQDGQVVKDFILENGSGIIPVKDLAAGMYFVQVGELSRGLIKE